MSWEAATDLLLPHTVLQQLSLFESMLSDSKFTLNGTWRQRCFGGCDSNINNDALQRLVFSGPPDIPEHCSGLCRVPVRPMNSKREAKDWTYQDRLSPESPLTGEYIKILPQSKQGKDDVVVGPREMGDGLGPWVLRSSRRQTLLQTWKLAPFRLWRLTNLRERKRQRTRSLWYTCHCVEMSSKLSKSDAYLRLYIAQMFSYTKHIFFYTFI